MQGLIMRKIHLIVFGLILLFYNYSCKDEEPVNKRYPSFSYLDIQIKFDSTQERLDSFGNISSIPSGHGAISPIMNSVSIGHIELLTDSTIAYGNGVSVLYQGHAQNGTHGYNCCHNAFEENRGFQTTLSENESNKTFNWIRADFVYQNYRIPYSINGQVYQGTLASFLAPVTFGYYFQLQDSVYDEYSIQYNGRWYLEVDTPGYGVILTDSALTLAPNELFNSSPVPGGGCIVTCKIDPPLYVGNPGSKSFTISLTTNNIVVQ